MREGCVHHWLIVGLLGTCKRCGLIRTFPELDGLTRVQYKEMAKQARTEVRAALGTKEAGGFTKPSQCREARKYVDQ